MKKDVILSIRGRQHYLDQEPEQIELVTQGRLEQTETGWLLSYEESGLTGLEGVTTTFLLEPGKVTLIRQGALNSRMVFEQGRQHDSLYEMDYGVLMITVSALKVEYEISEQGGTMDLVYGIEIEQSATGMIDYHFDVRTKE